MLKVRATQGYPGQTRLLIGVNARAGCARNNNSYLSTPFEKVRAGAPTTTNGIGLLKPCPFPTCLPLVYLLYRLAAESLGTPINVHLLVALHTRRSKLSQEWHHVGVCFVLGVCLIVAGVAPRRRVLNSRGVLNCRRSSTTSACA